MLHIGRRREDGDGDTFVIQFGEDGRLRLDLPDLASDASIEAVVAEAQARLAEELGVPVPPCPRHPHVLLAEFGVPEMGDELARALKDAAAPLPVHFHHESPRFIRVG